jgi:hypothetical protein
MRMLIVALVLGSAAASAAPAHLTFRYLHVGRALSQYDVTTYALTLDGDKARLDIDRGLTDTPAPDETGPYVPQKPVVYNGKATATKAGFDLAFELAKGEVLEKLSCRWKSVDIAGAAAVRIKTPHFDSECGDRGVFSPAKTTRLRALVCGPDDEFVFGDGAGIERAGLSEECYIQGAGLRAIADDHAIRRVSPKR